MSTENTEPTINDFHHMLEQVEPDLNASIPVRFAHRGVYAGEALWVNLIHVYRLENVSQPTWDIVYVVEEISSKPVIESKGYLAHLLVTVPSGTKTLVRVVRRDIETNELDSDCEESAE